MHADDGNTQICNRCENDYFVSEDKLSCVLSCPNIVLVDQQPDVQQRVNRCVQDNNLPNCSKAVVYGNKKVCVQCKTGFLKSVQADENKELIALNPNDLTVRVGVHHLGFSCLQKQNG